MKKLSLLIQRNLLLLAAFMAAFSPLLAKEDAALPAQLTDTVAFAPMVDLDRLAFKDQTIGKDSYGRPHITTLGLALRSYGKDVYQDDEAIIDEGVINNICLYSHVVSELTQKARLQAGRAAFARETLTLKKKSAILRKQAAIKAIDPEFRAKIIATLSQLTPGENTFLEVATQQYELRPINIQLTRALEPINWSIIPLALQAYASTLSAAESAVLDANQALAEETMSRSLKEKATYGDFAKIRLEHLLLKDSRKAAFVATFVAPVIGAIILSSKERDINRWGTKNLAAYKKNHQLYSLLYQVTEGLQFAGDIARFAWWWLLVQNGATLAKTLLEKNTSGYLSPYLNALEPSAARNGSVIIGRFIHGVHCYLAAGKLASLIERKKGLEEQVTQLNEKIAHLNSPDEADYKAELRQRVEALTTPDTGEIAQVSKEIEEEKKRVEPALTKLENEYAEREHKAHVTTTEKIEAQLAKSSHLEGLKAQIAQNCASLLKAAKLANKLAAENDTPAYRFMINHDPEGLFRALLDSPKAEAINITDSELSTYFPQWFAEVVEEFKAQDAKVTTQSLIPGAPEIVEQTLKAPTPEPAIRRDPLVSPRVDKSWKDVIRKMIGAIGHYDDLIMRGGEKLDNNTPRTTSNFFTDPTPMEDAYLGFDWARGGPVFGQLSEDDQILRKITLKGAATTARNNLGGFSTTKVHVHSEPVKKPGEAQDTFNNPIAVEAYKEVLKTNNGGTLTSPASYWALRGAQAAIPAALVGAAPTLGAIKTFASWLKNNSAIQPTQKLMVDFAHYTRGAAAIYRHIAAKQEIMENLPSHIRTYFEQFFGEKAQPELAEIISLCEHKAFDSAKGFMWHVGALARLVDLLNKHIDSFQELSQAMGYIDYLALLSEMVAPENTAINEEGQEIKWSFPRFVESERPYINFKGMWYPGYKPVKVISTAVQLGGESKAQHLLITGVNGCGKSIVMSAMMSNVVFAHTHGIVPSHDAELSPVDIVMFHGNIDDAKIDGYSKGIAEILHSGRVLKKIVEQMNQKGKKLRAYITMDELFCSTDQETATTLAKVVLGVIMQDPDAMLIFTTHNKELTTLEGESGGRIKNAYVDTDIDVKEEKVIYKRQLVEGVNKLSPALFIMKERFKESGVDDPFVIGILDNAIAYQKARQGFGTAPARA